MIIVLIIAAIIVIRFLSNLPDNKNANQMVPFDIAFKDQIGQDPASYIKSKLASSSDLGAIRYLFEIVEAEIEKRSKCKSPGFDFYYAKAISTQEDKKLPLSPRKPAITEIPDMNRNQRHHWTIEEDALCCRRFFEQYVIQRSSMGLQFFAQQLHRELPDISVRSLRMKTQNIQQLCIEHGIRSSLDARPLSQYSQQNRRAFMQVKKEFGL